MAAPVPTPLPKLERIPPHIASVADYEELAHQRLEPRVWAYLAGGAADERTLADNVAAFARYRLRSRVLADLSHGGTGLTLLGTRLSLPLLLAPVAFHKLFHPDGEAATALAAAAHGVPFVVSTQASTDLQSLARQAQGPLWFQLYIQHDRDFTLKLVRQAEAAGYAALVLTLDAPVNGLRNREQRAGFVMPPGIEAVNLRGMAPAPAATTLLGGPLLAVAPTWQDLAWLRAQTRLPLLAKGIMHPEDARLALEHGIDGIVVSNHGGRILDGQPATIDVLAEIVAAVGGRAPVLLDGGIRRGTDILVALALGATAVLVGRPFAWGLAAAGALGVSHVIQLLRSELELAMALTGCADLAAISRLLLWNEGNAVKIA